MQEFPFFYFSSLTGANGLVKMDDDMRRHVVTVLRMQKGDRLMLIDGKGCSAEAIIEVADKKNLLVAIGEKVFHPKPVHQKKLAISILKNHARFEWMLEKVTEIGVTDVFPLIAERTERIHFRKERMQQIVISASLQSKQFWMPMLHEPINFMTLVDQKSEGKKYIAHCLEEKKTVLRKDDNDMLLLIGPEGDFTIDEIKAAIHNQFIPVTLGDSRLRTETAGVVGAVLMNI